MNSKAALVIGTSRPDGNTWRVLRGANEVVRLPIFDLASMRVSYFDYHHANIGDDFITIIEELLESDTIGLVTQVYWYSVSAQMKTFIDRLSDLLGPRKDLGRHLRGRRLFLMATGSSKGGIPECMEQMLGLTAEYLGMRYEGSHYSCIVEDLVIETEVVDRAKMFREANV